MATKNKHTTILYMANRSQLVELVEGLAESGEVVTCVTPLREMREPNMDGVVVTDWLVVHYPAQTIAQSK